MRIRPFLALLTGISLGAIALSLPADAASGLQSPAGNWTLTKSEKKDNPRASYCTISRKFSGDVIFNYARNGDGELSIAFDFQKKELDKKASYTVNLNPGGTNGRDFQARPLTTKVLLVNLGADEKFEQALMGTEELSVTVAGEPSKLAVDEFSTQARNLKNCVASFGGKSAGTEVASKETEKAPTPPPASENDTPTKTMRMTDDAPLTPPTVSAAAPTPTSTTNPAASFEATERLALLEKENADLKRTLASQPADEGKAAQTDTELKNALAEKSALEQKLSAQASEIAQLKADQAKMTAEKGKQVDTAQLQTKLSEVSAEKTALDQKLAAQAKEIADLKAAQTQLQAEVAAKPAATPADAVALKAAQTQQAALEAKLAEQAKEIASLKAGNGDVAAITAERDQLKIEMAKLKDAKAQDAAKPTQAPTEQTEKMKLLEQQIASLTSENKMLAEKAKISLPDNAMKDAETKSLKDEIERLKQANSRLEDEISATVAAGKGGSPMPPPLPIADAVDQQAIEALNEQVAALETENNALKDQIKMMPQNDKLKDVVSMEQPLREEIRSLRAQLDEARAQSQTLSKLVDQTRAKVSADQLSVAGKNWDLEQATRRYQESEREVQRLSLQLEQQKVQCTNAKRELEYMMFDPQTAPAAQTAMLNSLEDKIAQQEKMLSGGGQRMANNSQPAVRMLGSPTAAPSAPPSDDLSTIGPASGADIQAAPLPALKPQAVAMIPPASAGRLPSTASFTPQAIPTGPARFLTPQDMQAILTNAQVPVTKGVQKLAKSSAPNALRWDTGQTFGSMEQREAKDPNAFRSLVQGYLDRTKARCKGDFAASPASSSINGVSAYDIACVSGGQSSSAAVAFYLKDGIFNVIAHEAAPAQMNMAMEARDKIVRSVVQ